jgi:hypothetical protein
MNFGSGFGEIRVKTLHRPRLMAAPLVIAPLLRGIVVELLDYGYVNAKKLVNFLSFYIDHKKYWFSMRLYKRT